MKGKQTLFSSGVGIGVKRSSYFRFAPGVQQEAKSREEMSWRNGSVGTESRYELCFAEMLPRTKPPLTLINAYQGASGSERKMCSELV